MRILIAGRIEFEGDICAGIITGGREHILASRQEKGCIAYDWSVDPLEPGVLHVFEEWESETDLGAHFRDPSYQAMRAHLETFPMTGFDVKLYRADEVEPVYSAEGFPRATIFGVRIDGEGA